MDDAADQLGFFQLAGLGRVQDFWKRNGLGNGAINNYIRWLRRFLEDCQGRAIPALGCVTAAGAAGFAQRYSRNGQIDCASVYNGVCSALHAWRSYLGSVGVTLPPWTEPRPAPNLPPILKEYLGYRRLHFGESVHRERRDRVDIGGFLDFFASTGRSVRHLTLVDVDRFLTLRRRSLAVATVSTLASSLREFLRFLYITGRLRSDLSEFVQCAKRRSVDVPRALPWSEIRRIVRAVDSKGPTGSRDYAILLLMAMYGLGAAEIISLSLDQIDWRQRTIDVIRPKTGVFTRLPLLPTAARALSVYLRHGRPTDAPTRAIFLRRGFPHVSFTSSAIRHMVRKYAARAGINGRPLGAHIFRHSHASRQVDLHASPVVLSEILGHRDPETTSIYARVAVERLRRLALPVPR